MDLHLHTPASNDYEQPKATYLEWLQAADAKGLDIVAITDHNTVAGVGAMRREIEWLTRLEEQKRLTDTERTQLAEWRRLADKILVLPGFEFTATFGFHILGIFPPETSVRQLEHILLSLNVPAEKLDMGSTETGSSADVITAYRTINEAGGMAIAAHANSTHGVAMRNFPFGGQTKISYTQDPNLIAIEVTDLESRSYQATRRFFNGSKPEYPRRMHCIQGSDAHRIIFDPKNPKRLGIGDRATEVLLDAPTYEELEALFESKQFDRTRPFHHKEEVVDELETAWKEGSTLVQSFHESTSQRGGRIMAILADVCAFANTSGGTIYLGASARKGTPKGLPKPNLVLQEVQDAMEERLTPPLDVKIEGLKSHGVNLLRISVPRGDERPYCLDGSKFYVRDDGDTNLAVRDEIVALVMETLAGDMDAFPQSAPAQHSTPVEKPAEGKDAKENAASKKRRSSRRKRSGKEDVKPQAETEIPKATSAPEKISDTADSSPHTIIPGDSFYLPQIGVEIVEVADRKGINYYGIQDLRNGRVVKNVTRKSARRLWEYAISQYEDHPVDKAKVEWKGDAGLIIASKRAGKVRYDLALRENGQVRIFYGVTDDGMEGAWAQFVTE
ncbi:MAG: putative DNA binding domain-containing protein [Caldilineaceae bacterium]|nr:putative DNA binding domain-containing protein [Caldilineaceae bacterium]MBP8125421.1 putative DNA binding domain-containing protein [Caldilineaceae bacterium]MBP9075153.1 putative DNA binding domain-containing protein [Caldilineaceae bacterium]